MPKIYIDPGHGGSDPGAEALGRKEANDTLKMGLAVGQRLEKQGFQVQYSRKTNTDKLVMDRAREANRWEADYFLSIHRNSFDGKATGNEIWVISTALDSTVKKAKQIVDALCAADGLVNRGVKKGAPSYSDFAVNKYTACPSALLEMGFITSETDNKALDTAFDRMASAIAGAVCDIFGISAPAQRIPGDVDGDGAVTSADARKALRAAARLEELSPEERKAADMDNDGKVGASDAREILRRAAKLPEE